MANDSEERQPENERQIDGADRNSNVEDSVGVSSGANPSSMTRRLTEILMEEGDGDLLLDREDGGVLQWIRALDMQMMGACRADERLKPLLKLNVSSGLTEDHLLSHLTQHFEPSEVGLLARCLCIPLVSIRVGKISKQGNLLSPTSVRGNLCLTLLPNSDLRISFNGDDGSIERLATLSTVAPCTAIEIEVISADKSGRSFLVKTSVSTVSYYWCAEKSKLLGDELLRKMNDLLVRKPSLAELTGISESRLNCFATHLRTYLAGSMLTGAQPSVALVVTRSSDDSVNTDGLLFPQSSSNCQKVSRYRPYVSHGSKTNLIYQASLSPRSSSFKEGLPKSLSSIRSAARDKLKRRGENCVSSIDSSLTVASSKSADPASSNCFEKVKLSEANKAHGFAPMNFLDILPFSVPEVHVPYSGPSQFSPHYCWCPPVASALQYTLGNSQLPNSSTDSLSLPLPPLSPLLSAAMPSSLLTSKPSLTLPDMPPIDFPSIFPHPLIRLPTSQQIPTFTPLMCDPIVHIPVIDVCSSGQGYLVSAGPSIMSTTIPPLNPNLVDPLLPNAESIVEKGARETLRMLISSSNQPQSQLFEIFPSVLSSSSDEQNVFAAGSRGLYSGTRDVGAITNSMMPMGLVLFSEKSMGGSGFGKRYAGRDDVNDQKEKPSSSDSSSFDAEIDSKKW